MLKIGIIFVGFNCADTLTESLTPWIQARAQKLGGHEFKICAVNCPFEGFPQDEEDSSYTQLTTHYANQNIDWVVRSNTPIKEIEARGAALKWLVERECDMIWQADADEFITIDQIEKVAKFVEKEKFTTCFKLSLKNYVFDTETYLIEPFQPMRIHRVESGNYKIHGFWDDNNAFYGGIITRDFIQDVRFPCLTIPSSLVWIRHLTWQNSDRSRRKVEYQERRWGKCSFKWNYKENKLEFNPAFPTPKIQKDILVCLSGV